MEERNVGTIGDKSPNHGLISTKDLPMELSEGRESPYYRLDWITNLIYGPWGHYFYIIIIIIIIIIIYEA